MVSWRIGFSRSYRRNFLRCIAATIIASGVLVGPGTAGASETCGEFSFGFEGTRLLNDGISNSAGPFPIELPAGTYDVTLVAHDSHSTQSSVETQPGEQFTVQLDNGYVSPPSLDIPDDADSTTTVHGSQEIPTAASAISVHHLGVPGINSVDVVCVGFDPIADTTPVEPVSATEPDDSDDPSPGDETTQDDPDDEDSSGETSTSDQDDPDDEDSSGETSTSDQDDPDDETQDDSDENSDDGASISNQDDETTTPAPEVRGAVEVASSAQVAQLAITGRNSDTIALFAFGLVLLGGSFVLITGRRENRPTGLLE